ncbi:trypco2 family protein [Actinacidiphila acididurans]|uniref:Trypsin-co-occurring domain-containing protein n=1 Tax=Actinacidiphila acididurans TaxID=2784346 RepID=A0ABS2U0K9_9ACTN|nr:trypco2 family protein [Actinacidiphila acididurans]MBM9508567.1 hypothetical protein [Actinacidiphila acididurans]
MADADHVEPVTGMELADAVEAIRQGLMSGAARGAGAGIRFEVGEIRMEFAVQLSRTGTGRAGVKAWVIDAGAERTHTDARTHTVSVTLRPKDPTTGAYLEIGAPRPGEDPDLSYEG